jgi:methyltransferase (TIGR00027 family)
MKKIPVRTDNDMIGSASVTALMRYLLSQEEGLAKNPDYLGKFFINGKWKDYLNDLASSREELQKKLPGCIYYHLIRTKTFDNSLLKWIKNEKNSQVIILGAGFDSRAIRFERLLKENNIKIYEIDLKAMLDYKKEIIENTIKTDINHVTFVACNFQKDNVIEKLSENNFDFNRPTLILWEGVTYFLTKDNIEYYLKLFRDNIHNKLQITLDYAFRDYIEGNLNFYGAKELYDILIELEEPHFFGLNYNETEDFFEERGFMTKSNYTSFMLEALYIKDNYGNTVGKPHAFHGMTEIIKK